MTSANDNAAPTAAARVLPILGKVDARGTVVLKAPLEGLAPPKGLGAVLKFPNDPREA